MPNPGDFVKFTDWYAVYGISDAGDAFWVADGNAVDWNRLTELDGGSWDAIPMAHTPYLDALRAEGSLVYQKRGPAFVVQGGQRHGFPSAEVFDAWGYDW